MINVLFKWKLIRFSLLALEKVHSLLILLTVIDTIVITGSDYVMVRFDIKLICKVSSCQED